MSYKLLIIPEDPTYNGYLLKPLFERVMLSFNKRNTFIHVLTNPKIGGFEHAKKELENICSRYRHFDIIIFIADND